MHNSLSLSNDDISFRRAARLQRKNMVNIAATVIAIILTTNRALSISQSSNAYRHSKNNSILHKLIG
jgi:hypothetical protein